ncbi:MAG TPA: DUF4124 domain-containing protein [Ramlibacter sp.]|jgi:hypothetical protein|nr:DUF4124 domain-containing protein [Ramlibacter sp.]
MKNLRITLLVLACMSATTAFAQWQWIDKSGRKVFSDQPPPADVPDSKIIRRAGGRPADPAPEPVAAASSKASAASMPKVAGKDKALEEKKKQAAATEAEKKKAQEEEAAKAAADRCDRAKRAKATMDSGIRIATTNAKGEREILDDNARADEVKRADATIARDCK